MSNENSNFNWGVIAFLIAVFMPIYAAFKDYGIGETTMAIIDIFIFPVGVFRGFMYLLG